MGIHWETTRTRSYTKEPSVSINPKGVVTFNRGAVDVHLLLSPESRYFQAGYDPKAKEIYLKEVDSSTPAARQIRTTGKKVVSINLGGFFGLEKIELEKTIHTPLQVWEDGVGAGLKFKFSLR